ncbi:SUKH-4 family immunity protein [Streptomyces sp. NPDC006339]|uniref:SUKH-4 family immunity protein n=1 Tax=Streptomyces sp. NPDC006339 TaxID=3156755 RepID=UPI0033AB7F10
MEDPTSVGTAPLTLAEDASVPALTHEPTRRWLATRGLPARHRLMSFRPLAEARVRTVRQHLLDQGPDAGARADELAEDTAPLLLLGHLLVQGEEADQVVLDGGTGRVFSLWLYEKDPACAERFPLAASVEALAGHLAAVDDFAALRGDFADLAGAVGPAAVAEAEARLTARLTEGEGAGALPVFWRIAARIRPLALIAGQGPATGLRLDLPRGLLEAEFGEEEIVRLAPADLPAALEHEPTRRFLMEVGLPREAGMFGLWEDEYLMRTLKETEDARSGDDGDSKGDGNRNDSSALPDGAERLVCLGSLVHDFEVVIHGATGRLYHRLYDSAEITPVNADVSTLAFTLWLHQREQRLDETEEFTADFYQYLADTMSEVLGSVDPVACAPSTGDEDYRYWPEVFHDEAGGVL